MGRLVVLVVGAGLGLGLGLAIPRMLAPPPVVPAGPDSATIMERVREVARLETLQVSVYRKVSMEEQPQKGDSTWQDVANWLRTQVKPVRGRAIVFGVAHVQLNVPQLQTRVDGRTVFVVLPPVDVHVELKPEETEVMVNENLGPTEVGQIMQLAKDHMEREVRADPVLRSRALDGARRSIRAMLAEAGVTDVRFVDALPPLPGHT